MNEGIERIESNDYNDIVLTIVGGQRPHLLARTLEALSQSAPQLLQQARVVAILNSVDSESTDILMNFGIEQIGWHWIEGGKKQIASVGIVTSMAADSAKSSLSVQLQRRFWMHVEDDWLVTEPIEPAIADARGILEAELNVRQVRLRHHAESVLSRNQVTNERIAWSTRSDGHREAPNAHLTFNPFLARIQELTKFFPAVGERDFQKRAHRAGYSRVVQLVPGSFVHIGGGNESLRSRTQCVQ